MDELITVPFVRLHNWWSTVREGLLEVAQRTEPDWIPEDVYVSLRAGESRLLIGSHENVFSGFAVVLDRVNPFNGTRTLIAWAVWIRRGVWLDPFIEKLLANARHDGYDKVMFQSPRLGWVRRLEKYQFRPRETIFECDLRSYDAGVIRPESTHKH